MSQQITDTKIKKVCCDIFKTEFTQDGVVAIFEDLVPYRPKLIFKSKPISYTAYIEFLNSELCKLRKDADVERPHSAPIRATHKGGKVCFDYIDKDVMYRVNPIKLQLYTQFFLTDFEKIERLIQNQE